MLGIMPDLCSGLVPGLTGRHSACYCAHLWESQQLSHDVFIVFLVNGSGSTQVMHGLPHGCSLVCCILPCDQSSVFTQSWILAIKKLLDCQYLIDWFCKPVFNLCVQEKSYVTFVHDTASSQVTAGFQCNKLSEFVMLLSMNFAQYPQCISHTGIIISSHQTMSTFHWRTETWMIKVMPAPQQD